jgi:hypothetical protein
MYKTVIYGFIRAVYTMRGCAVVVLGPKPQIKGQKNEKQEAGGWLMVAGEGRGKKKIGTRSLSA